MGVIRWIQQGKLKAHTTPGGHYRIRIADFRDFLERFHIPVDSSFFEAREPSTRILVIASDPLILGTIVKALCALPERYQLDVALNGASAVAKLTHPDLGLVILDTTAPNTDTPELHRWLAENPEGPRVPLLLLTEVTTNQTPEGQEGTAEMPSLTTKPLQAIATREGMLDKNHLEVEELRSIVQRLLTE
jgi:CheY-like chemotaxis protein